MTDKLIESYAGIPCNLFAEYAEYLILKDLYVLLDNAKSSTYNQAIPFLVLRDLLKNGVEVRLLHAKEPGSAFREDFDKFPQLWSKLERRLCPISIPHTNSS